MEQQGKIEGSGFSPSFSFHTSDTSTSTAAAKVIREEQAARFHEFGGFNEDDFEFSVQLSDDDVSANEIDSRGWTEFPVFNRELLVKKVELKPKDDEIHSSDSITGPLQKLFIDEQEESSSSSSSEADELEILPPGTYCLWRPKADGGSSPTKIKKSSSTGSVSKKWKIRYLLRRSNSEGKEPVVLSTPKKVESPKQKRSSGEVSRVTGRLKAQTTFHEQFYVQRRAENEVGKRKLYLPYKQVGLFTNINGMGKMLHF